ncbi:hypothetical protein BpHYR1_005813 [Brachionus plicatilis]|uniref:Uncharacterized protein n=1 Tax=Brachionus plicatilis TaxID=10195 RepID=A0A3M7QDS4_BRAPC|nr:hypothetical protein BpHYR1_005813 [Brachionus plicatilis]
MIENTIKKSATKVFKLLKITVVKTKSIKLNQYNLNTFLIKKLNIEVICSDLIIIFNLSIVLRKKNFQIPKQEFNKQKTKIKKFFYN